MCIMYFITCLSDKEYFTSLKHLIAIGLECLYVGGIWQHTCWFKTIISIHKSHTFVNIIIIHVHPCYKRYGVHIYVVHGLTKSTYTMTYEALPLTELYAYLLSLLDIQCLQQYSLIPWVPVCLTSRSPGRYRPCPIKMFTSVGVWWSGEDGDRDLQLKRQFLWHEFW